MTESKTNNFPSALSTLALASFLALCSTAVLAQPVPALALPDAGQVLRNLQQPPALAPAPAAPLQRSANEADAAGQPEEKVQVRAVTITGNQALPTAELEPLLAGLAGSQQTLTGLNAAARRITAYYRARGFAVARAYLPQQDITDGQVTIAIIEGRIAAHKISNQSLLSDERAGAYLGEIRDGDVIRSAQIDRGLLLLQDTPGVSTSRATLQPGASVGTSELLVEVNPAAPYTASVVADNHGSRYTGEYRVSGTFNVASPLKIGDLVTVSALTSGDKLSFARLAYQLPVGSNGLRVGAAYFDTRYKLGQEFESLQAHGTASSTSVFAGYPFIRSQLENLSGLVSIEDKRMNDYIDSTATATPKKVTVTSLGLSGNRQDALAGGGIISGDLSLILGQLHINSPSALAIDAASAHTSGSYTRIAYSASRLQRLTDNTQLSVALTGQQAGKNLDSSEKFSLGGPNAIRAYPVSEATGDQGYRGTVEVRHSLTANVQGTAFYDFGSVTLNKNPFGPAAVNKRNLAGAGFGVNANVGLVQLRGSLAWRTHGGLPTSVPASAARRPTLWMQASVGF